MMKRIDAFFILIVFIVMALGYTFFYASTSKDFFENNPKLQAQFERQRQLARLQKELAELNEKRAGASRGIASLPPVQGVVPEAVTFKPETAEQHFATLKEICGLNDEQPECLSEIDLVITQFPETVWAAESMLVLLDIYQKNHESRRSVELVKIIRTRFGQFAHVQAKVNYYEKKPL
ncbi:MAG: hypothetical protein K2P92_03545 [Bdellovibrionaceae bacterium]|nr:hypothetical protein [Pseudobdellovibrionaceae bacterium]